VTLPVISPYFDSLYLIRKDSFLARHTNPNIENWGEQNSSNYLHSPLLFLPLIVFDEAKIELRELINLFFPLFYDKLSCFFVYIIIKSNLSTTHFQTTK
jgi:hypothetical protein